MLEGLPCCQFRHRRNCHQISAIIANQRGINQILHFHDVWHLADVSTCPVIDFSANSCRQHGLHIHAFC